ncbi:hypothetical protein CVT26_002918 [Gymnopilus dilepis]|uniref:Uncharacterized protein n=1 Tax=Gymnopilus dilepis TaxID=231916 RepID=A0A409W2F4_9AGAR|nr:hypothetical protein CVT26_002918 [Gymnopilus dilepis]
MAHQGVSDAAAISPYPFVVRQERAGPSSSETDERGPHPKGKKARARARAERNRQDEEPRFNIGPPRNTRHPANRTGRRGFLNRLPGAWYPEDSNVPDYPPPSFQEAITTPPISVCSSTTSLVPQPTLPLAIPEDIPERPRAPPEPELAPVPFQEHNSNGMATSDDATDSDESMFIIDPHSVPVASSDIPKPPGKTKSDWRKLRSADFLHKSSRVSPTKSDDEHPKINRVRTINASSVLQIIDPDVSDTHLTPPSPISSPKRKLMSLSPLKTMFPRSASHEDRETLSALPSPSSSPYPTSRSVFFRSSTSLATASFLRLPLLSTAGSKSEPLSRKLFKGKEKAKDRESIDTWEVLSEEAYEGVDSEGHPTFEQSPSLISAVESLKSRESSSPPRVRISTSTNHGATAFPTQLGEQSDDPQEREFPISSRAAQDTASRERKGMSTLFIDRPLNRGRTPVSAPLEDVDGTINTNVGPMSSVSSLSMLPPGPPLTTVRVRAKSPSPQPPPQAVRHPKQVIHLSPLRVDATVNAMDDQHSTGPDMYQKALDTPLPLTPVYQNHFEAGGSENPTGLADRQIPDLDSNSARVVSPAKLTLSVNPSTTTLLGPASVKEPLSPTPMSPTRHHYVGRPLPRPPAPASTSRVAIIDSIYASSESSGYSQGTPEASNPCPEGLLIDLEDTSFDSINPPSRTSTPLADEGVFYSMTTSSSSAADLLQLVDPPPPPTSMQGLTPRPHLTPPGLLHHSNSAQRNDSLEVTDLDVLVSRLADREANDGSDYEVSVGRKEWKELGLSKPPDASLAVGGNWTRQTLIPRPVVPSRHLPESQPQRQYTAHWAH